jgi:hypothetical protein
VYLGSIITLLSAGVHALDPVQRDALLDALDVPAQTLHRWRHWWTRRLPASATWRALSGWFSPPIQPNGLPGELLSRLQGATIERQLTQLLTLISPLTTCSCSPCVRAVMDTQKM